MSILDSNAVEYINKEAEGAAKIIAAKQPIINTFSDAFLALKHAQHIQKWLYDHALFQSQYEIESLTTYAETQYINWEVERDAYLQMHYLQMPTGIKSHYFTNEDFIHLPKAEFQLISVMQRSKYAQYNDSYGEIRHEVKTIESYTPRPLITKYVSGESGIYSQTTLTYSNRNTSDRGATLFLKDIDCVPLDIIEKDDNGFYHWIMPIKDIYLYDCPNISQDILDLPYVHTFEEMGWYY